MKKQQAIDLLDNLIGMIEDNQDNDYDTAFRMAIEALKAQLSQEGTTSDAISRQAAIDEILRKCTSSKTADELRAYVKEHGTSAMWSGGLLDAIRVIECMSSAQPEPCEDAISRQAAIDALQKCRKHCIDPFDSYHIDIQDAENQLSKVPPAQPEPHGGYWIPHEGKCGHGNASQGIRGRREDFQISDE